MSVENEKPAIDISGSSRIAFVDCTYVGDGQFIAGTDAEDVTIQGLTVVRSEKSHSTPGKANLLSKAADIATILGTSLAFGVVK